MKCEKIEKEAWFEGVRGMGAFSERAVLVDVRVTLEKLGACGVVSYRAVSKSRHSFH